MPFHLIAQCQTGIVVLSTVAPTSFTCVDSFEKMRFRFIAEHLPILLQETELGGSCDVLPFHLIAQCLTGIMVLSTVVPTLIKVKVQVEMHVGDLSPILSMNSLWED